MLTKTTAREVWYSLKVRFIGMDHVKAAPLSILRSEFDWPQMGGGEELDTYAGRIGGIATRYAGFGATLGDAAMVKKLLDMVPDQLFAVVPGIKQFLRCQLDAIRGGARTAEDVRGADAVVQPGQWWR